MTKPDWLANNQGQCVRIEPNVRDQELSRPYRLYRFLTDLENILEQVEDDQKRLHLICPLVRRLINNSEWLQFNFLPPDPVTGWSVLMLYNELGNRVIADTAFLRWCTDDRIFRLQFKRLFGLRGVFRRFIIMVHGELWRC
ncbi:MAG: hypothetical protein WBB43_08705 [Limnoraphis sp.]